jgi:hypothetical protein
VPGVINYEAKAALKYLEEEDRNAYACRKYSVGGEGLQNQYGTLWLDLEWLQAVDIEIPTPDNPAWNSFKFALVSWEIMDDGPWVQILDGEIKKLEAVG